MTNNNPVDNPEATPEQLDEAARNLTPDLFKLLRHPNLSRETLRHIRHTYTFGDNRK